MEKVITYSEKLKDPRWQKKRLEVLNRDEFTCTICDDKESTLHVHHHCYSGKNPWDASVDDLTTLCEACHYITHKYDISPITGFCLKGGHPKRMYYGFFGQSEDRCFQIFSSIDKGDWVHSATIFIDDLKPIADVLFRIMISNIK